MKPELIADYQCVCGEAPLWHPDEQRVYWADLEKGCMFRYHPASGHHEQVYQAESRDQFFGGCTLQADGALLLFMARGAVRTWRDGKMTTLIDEIPDERKSIFNDVIADPKGRVFCGTVPVDDRLGRLYRLDTDGSLTLLVEGIDCSNGMGFTPDLKQMYYTDSTRYEIYIFDYDQDTGAISNQRIFVKGPEEDGLPDGMTVDAEGYVWSAHWDGSCVIRYAPHGREDMRVEFPAKQVSSLIFGGPDYTDMYVTTAGGDDKEKNGPGAGALFRANVGIKGVPEFRSRIGI